MNADEFRHLALALPETAEAAHMHHPDFRVAGKIFATLGPGETWGMVKLGAEQQALFVCAEPHVYEPASGAWGRGGATLIHLELARKASVRRALLVAWRNTAPKRLARQHDID